MSDGRHLVIACGGTGGHFYPTLSVARQFCSTGGKVTFLVSGKHAEEQQRIAREWGFEAQVVETVRRPAGIGGLFAFPFRLLRCLRKSRQTLQSINGDILLGMGSFAAFPPCLAWVRSCSKPLVLHEGNTIMGRTNRFFATKAAAIALSLPLRDKTKAMENKCVVTGMPLRDSVLTAAATAVSPEEKQSRLAEWGLQPDRKTVLVFGGSQGALAINRLLCAAAEKIGKMGDKLQFVILTGSDDNQPMIDAFKNAGVPARILRADQEIQRYYQCVDLVICRGGASSICEVALFGKPTIIIPLPSAADNHQYWNAMQLQQNDAARCLEQAHCTPEVLVESLENFLKDESTWQQMGQRMKEFARPDATARVCALLQERLAQ